MYLANFINSFVRSFQKSIFQNKFLLHFRQNATVSFYGEDVHFQWKCSSVMRIS